jgi:hypothetical protein
MAQTEKNNIETIEKIMKQNAENGGFNLLPHGRQEYYEILLEQVRFLKERLEKSKKPEETLEVLYDLKKLLSSVATDIQSTDVKKDAEHLSEAAESVRNYAFTKMDLVAGLQIFIETIEKIIAEEKRQKKAKELRDIFNQLGENSYNLVPILNEIKNLVDSND